MAAKVPFITDPEHGKIGGLRRTKNGQKSSWYQAAARQKAGRIIAAGMTKEVAFEPVDGPINYRIDDA